MSGGINKKLNDKFLTLFIVTKSKMDYELNDTAQQIYNDVKDKMEFWRDYVYMKSDKSFETQLEEYIFETYNSKSYLDFNEFPYVDNLALDLLDIAREISKYYQNDFGVHFKIHEYTNKKIINLFALLCAEDIQETIMMFYNDSPDCYDRVPNGVCNCSTPCGGTINRIHVSEEDSEEELVSDSESEDEIPLQQ